MSKSKYIEIHSQDRNTLTSASSTDFTYDLPYELNNVECLGLSYVCIPFTYYTMSNATINTNLGGAVFVGDNYTAATLATYLFGLLTSIGHALVNVAFNPATQKFTISTGAIFSLSFNDELKSALGMTTNSLSGLNTYASVNPTLINYINRDLYIHIDQLTSPIQVSNVTAQLNPTFSIKNHSAIGDNIVYHVNSDWNQISNCRIGDIRRRLQIRLTNKSGSIINLNGGEWKMIIKFLYN